METRAGRQIEAGFAREHSGIAIRVVEEMTPILLDRLHDEAIDVAVVALPVPGEWSLSVELFEEPMLVVVPAKHRLRAARGHPSERFEKRGHCFRQSTITACRRARVTPNVVFESGQFETILAMVSVGAGVSVVPEMAARPVKGCRYVRIADQRAKRKIGAVMLRRHFERCAQRVFLRHRAQVCLRRFGMAFRENETASHTPDKL